MKPYAEPSLSKQLAQARRRLETAQAQQRITYAKIQLETTRIQMLESRMHAGSGHIFPPDPDLSVILRWPSLDPPSAPCCRLCGTPMGSIAGGKPCRGDRWECQAPVAEGETPTAFRRYGREGWFCGLPGRHNATYTTWTCTAGHVVGERHPDYHASALAAALDHCRGATA